MQNNDEKDWLLWATKHNWGFAKAGDWRGAEWFIYRDGSCKIISYFNSSLEEAEEMLQKGKLPQPKTKMITGKMVSVIFSKLNELINSEPWRDPNIHSKACDGAAWEIKTFKSNGSIDKTSGELGFIYGHPVLEAIVELLPSDNLYIKP